MDSQISQTGKTQRGFTLIELMTIIVIIGLISSFIVVQAIPYSKPISLKARLELTLREISERSLLEQKWYGLQVEENRFRTVRFDRNHWIATSKNWQSLPDETEFSTGNSSSSKNGILIYSNLDGILSHQRLIISTKKEKIIIEAPKVYEYSSTGY